MFKQIQDPTNGSTLADKAVREVIRYAGEP